MVTKLFTNPLAQWRVWPEKRRQMRFNQRVLLTAELLIREQSIDGVTCYVDVGIKITLMKN